MALTKESKILGLDDVKVFAITEDTVSALSYAAAVDVPGINQLKVTPNFVEKELKGDETILDTYSKLDSIEWSFENSIMSLDALALMLGGDVTETGTTPNQVQTYRLNTADVANYFKLEGKVNYADVGDVHIILHKCKASKVDYSFVGEDFAKVSASGKAIGTKYDGNIKDIVFNETATAINAGAADTTAPTVTPVPADAATGVSVSADLTWTFSEAIRPDCVTSANFFVMKGTDGSLIAGTLSLGTGNTVVTFNPDSNLTASTAHIAVCTTNVMDVAGNRLATNCVTNFTTA